MNPAYILYILYLNFYFKFLDRLDIVVNQDPTRHGDTNNGVYILRMSERARDGKWNGSPYTLDQFPQGMEETAPTWFLLPYWLWKYIE